MTFLNPAVLIGLLAASFPLLLHLLNLRKLRTVEFSTISFLQALQKSTLRRLKFQYWILLIFRTLLVLLVVFAFARPVLRGTLVGGAGTHSATTMIILLDDSYSMGRTDERGVLLSQAQLQATMLLSLLGEGDDGLVMKLSDGGRSPFDAPTQNISLLKTIVRETKLSAIHHPIDDALRASARLLRQSTSPNKEIYILSDAQRTNIESQRDSSTVHLLFHNDVNIFYSMFGRSSTANAGIIDTRVENTIIDLDRPCIVGATVKNFGQSPLRSFVISAYLGNIRVQQKTVELTAGQSTTVEFPLLLQHTGLNNGSIRIEDDQCEYDNIRYFSVNVPETIRILLVAQSPADFSFVRTALALSQSSTRPSLFSVTYSSWGGLTSVNLRDIDIIASSLPNDLPAEALLRLKEYANHGGTLLLFPSGNLISPSVRRLARALNLSGIDSIAGNRQDRKQFRTLDNVDDRHPIFNGMFEVQQNDRTAGVTQRRRLRLSDAPRVFQSVVIHPAPANNTLITLSDGNGFLTEFSSGDGRIMVFAVPPTSEWSEFPLKGLFVPLLYRTMLYSAHAPIQENAPLCGDPVNFSFPQLRSEDQVPWSIVGPDGDETRVKPLLIAGRHIMEVTGSTSLAGLYTLMHGPNPYIQQAVNMDPAESDLIPLEESALRSHIAAYGIPNERIIQLDPAKDMRTAILESRYGRELWRFALLGALLCALVEMLIAYLAKRNARQESV